MISIGNYRITQEKEGIWIANMNLEGEAMLVSEDKFFTLIDKFYQEEF